MTSKNIILEPNYTMGYNKGKQEERQRIKEVIVNRINIHWTLCNNNVLLFEEEVLALLEEGK
jgi:hypothetical protein